MREQDDLIGEQLDVDLGEEAGRDAVLDAGGDQLVGVDLLLLDQVAPRFRQRRRFAIAEQGGGGLLVVDGAISDDRRAETLQRLAETFQRGRNVAMLAVEHLDQRQKQHILLVDDVPIDGTDADVGALSNVANGGVVIAAFAEQIDGSRNDLPAPQLDQFGNLDLALVTVRLIEESSARPSATLQCAHRPALAPAPRGSNLVATCCRRAAASPPATMAYKLPILQLPLGGGVATSAAMVVTIMGRSLPPCSPM